MKLEICKSCGDKIENRGKDFVYKNLCYECSIGEKVWKKIKKEAKVKLI